MDLNPNSFPILSSVMSRLPKVASFKSPQFPFDQHDIELLPPSNHPRHRREDDVELMERFPCLQHPAFLASASMVAAISDVDQTRSVLRALGERAL